MKDHKIGGNFVQKYFEKEGDALVSFPSELKELRQALSDGIKVKMGDVEKVFSITEEKILGWAYRGFSLQHQGGGESLSEEEKTARKEERKKINANVKTAKSAGLDLAALIAAEIERRKSQA